MTWSKNVGLIFVLFLFLSIKNDPFEIKNFHRVNDVIFRSGQPTGKGMKQLEKMGVKSILNLRNVFNDRHEIKSTNLILIHLPMQAKNLSEEDIFHALLAIRNAEKPLLVHCYHGSDRTGGVIAAYRMVFQNWSREKAISEFRKEELGYNFKLFPNILHLIEELDIKELKKKCTKNLIENNNL